MDTNDFTPDELATYTVHTFVRDGQPDVELTAEQLAHARTALAEWAAEVDGLPVGIDADRLEAASDDAFTRAAERHGLTPEALATVQHFDSLPQAQAIDPDEDPDHIPF